MNRKRKLQKRRKSIKVVLFLVNEIELRKTNKGKVFVDT